MAPQKDEKDAGNTMRNPLSKKIVDIEPSGTSVNSSMWLMICRELFSPVGEPDFDMLWSGRKVSIEREEPFIISKCRSDGA